MTTLLADRLAVSDQVAHQAEFERLLGSNRQACTSVR
jgi:hypothetical protein